MGARICCMNSHHSHTSLKRADYSIESSTASESSTLADNSEVICHAFTASGVREGLSFSGSQAAIGPSGGAPMCSSHGRCHCSFTHCNMKPHLPRVSSGGLTPIEEEPRPNHTQLRHSSSYSTMRPGRSRTVSNDSFDSCNSSSFGSMRNYQKFVLTRS